MLLINSSSPANTVGNNPEPLASGIQLSAFRLVTLSPLHFGSRNLGGGRGSPAGCAVLLEGNGGKATGSRLGPRRHPALSRRPVPVL